MDLSSLTILSNDTRTQIEDMGTATDSIDFVGLINALDVATVTADFSALTSSLQTSADMINGNAGLVSTRVSSTAKLHLIIGGPLGQSPRFLVG